MTKDEAIKRLDDIRRLYKRFHEKNETNMTKSENEAFDLAIEALKKNAEPCKNWIYEELLNYFQGDDLTLRDQEEFRKWLERIKWHIKKCDELARKIEKEPREDAVSRKLVKRIIDSPRNKDQMLRMLDAAPSVQPKIEPCEDCISRERLKRVKYPTISGRGGEVISAYKRGWNNAIDAIIEREPSVKPERKTGWWKLCKDADGDGGYAVCSECNEWEFATSNFCPNCGAEMKGEE